MPEYNDYGSRGGIRMPKVTDTPIELTVELLALANYVFQSTGTLEAVVAAQDFPVGHLMAIKASTNKYVPYAQGGSGGEEVCVGFLRIACTTEAGADAEKDQACEVVVGGAVKWALVAAAANYHADALADLGARANTVADALIF